MTRLTIDTGTAGNPATGDTLRTAMTKVNSNFAELAGDLQMSGNTLLSADTNYYPQYYVKLFLHILIA